MEVTEWGANGTIRKGRARRMEKEVPRRPWWRGGTGGRKKGEEDERPAQTASRQRLLVTDRKSNRGPLRSRSSRGRTCSFGRRR